MSEQPGNLLTLRVNKAVNPTDATRPSITFHWNQGVALRWSGAFFIGASLTECVGEGECVSRAREGRGARPRGHRPSRHGPGSYPARFGGNISIGK